MGAKPKYKRILLKVSGELLKGSYDFGFDSLVISDFVRQVKSVVSMGVELALVVGGGNIFRGVGPFAHDMDRTTADNIGMLATLINALMLQDAFEKKGIEVRILSAIPSPNVAEPFIRRRALKHLEEGRVVIFACGTGSPFFTTDTETHSHRASPFSNSKKCRNWKKRLVFSASG